MAAIHMLQHNLCMLNKNERLKQKKSIIKNVSISRFIIANIHFYCLQKNKIKLVLYFKILDKKGLQEFLIYREISIFRICVILLTQLKLKIT